MQITCYSTVLRDNNSTSFCNLFMRQLQQLVSLPEEMNTSVFVPQKVLKSLTTVGVSWFTSLVICFSHRLPAFHSNLLRKSPSPSLEKGCLIFTGVTPFIFLIETIIPTNTAALEMQCCHLPSWASTNTSFVMLSFNPANAQWPLQMLFSSMHCLLHVPISLVTKVLELLNWNGEVSSCRRSKVGQVGLGLTDPGSPSSQLQLKFCFVRHHIKHIWENTHCRAAGNMHCIWRWQQISCAYSQQN